MAITYSGLENVGIYGIKDVGMISFISNLTKKETCYINYANNFKFDAKAESVKGTGNGVEMVSFDGVKKASGEFALELASMELMAFANGASLTTSLVDFYEREVVTCKSADEVVTLKKSPVAGSVHVYKLQADGRTKIGELTTATVSNSNVTCVGAKSGDLLAISYITQAQAQNFSIKATSELSQSCTMVLRCKGKTATEGAFVPMQLTFPNVNALADNAFEFDATKVSPVTLKVDILGDSLENMVKWALVPDTV